MGWLWASSNDPISTPAPPQNTTPSERSTPPQSSNPNPTDPPSSTPSHDEPSPELAAFLTALRPPPPKASPSYTSPQSSPLQSDTITPRQIHPTQLSCRAAFDTAFYCASLGGQFTSLYRYGSLRACSQQWSDFWFCVRTNRGMYSDEEREARVLRRAMVRERERYRDSGGGGFEVGVGTGGESRGLSSEDIWEQRGRMVKGAFGGDYWGAVAEAEKERRGKAERGDGEGNGWS